MKKYVEMYRIVDGQKIVTRRPLAEVIKKLHSEGKSYKKIMALLGCSKGTISYHTKDDQRLKTNIRIKNSRYMRKKREAIGNIIHSILISKNK